MYKNQIHTYVGSKWLQMGRPLFLSTGIELVGILGKNHIYVVQSNSKKKLDPRSVTAAGAKQRTWKELVIA